MAILIGYVDSRKNISQVRLLTRYPICSHSAKVRTHEAKMQQLKFRVAVISAKNPQAPTPQAPIRNRQTRKVANAKSSSPQYLPYLT